VLPTFLEEFDYCGYKGFYHTDFTIPSLYFIPSVTRPENAYAYDLDFTYLFDSSLDNSDYDRMGQGRRIRNLETLGEIEGQEYARAKRQRGSEMEVRIDDQPRLREALRSRR
jgi:hypothetical protein